MQISIAELVMDPTLHVRAGINEDVVRDYAERDLAAASGPGSGPGLDAISVGPETDSPS